ncbi:MAG: hypothetical protein F6J87_14365 [Spirulina sp. SIO3F2]|nr:hypothetical protein [Spirulina sp. SIO3F2]
MNTQSSESTDWCFDIGSNHKVDFCLWALQWDGLRVAPFQSHPDGTAELRNLGLNAQDWITWFYKVVYSQNSQLLGVSTEEAKQAVIEHNLEALEILWQQSPQSRARKNLELERKLERERLEKAFDGAIEAHQEAVALAAPYGFRNTPPEIWHGSQDIGALLEQLWAEYESYLEQQRQREKILISRLLSAISEFVGVTSYILFGHVMFSALLRRTQLFRQKVPPLQIIEVNYPTPITLTFPPGLAVTSYNMYLGNLLMHWQVERIVKNLYESDQDVSWIKTARDQRL